MPNQAYASLVSIQIKPKGLATMITPMLERHLAMLQMKHYLSLHQSAIATGDHNEMRRVTLMLDRLVSEYGTQALHEAQENSNE